MRAVFHAYGLRLGANQAIPGLTPDPCESRVDVLIQLGSLPTGVNEFESSETGPRMSLDSDDSGRPRAISWHSNGAGGFRLRYDDGTVFVIDGHGSRIWAVWPETMTLEDTVVYLLGPVLAFVLRLRGTTCLHASAFSVDGRAVALVGPSGAGKSTTAAAFAGRGFAVLSDDLLALDEQHESVIAYPGCPRVRLWPEAAEILYGAGRELPLLTPNWDKRYLDLRGDEGGFERRPLPLSAIYLLDERRDDPAAPFVDSPSASTGLLNLLANLRGDCYPDKQSHRRDFDMLGRVIQRVPVRRVAIRTGPDSLTSLCDAILADLARMAEHTARACELTCTI